MYLNHLSLTNFRNFARLDIDVPKGVTLLVGDNAQGKTSLLEAIYFLATFASFDTSLDRQLINFLASREPLAVARIVADFSRHDIPSSHPAHRIEVRIIQEVNGLNGAPRVRKEVLLDGVKQKMNDVLGQFNAVLFLPQSLRVIDGPPEERRRFLNLTLAQVIPHYAAYLSDYNRALAQRNALLKQLGERSGDLTQLAYWDDRLSSSGARLIHWRIRALHEIEKSATESLTRLTSGSEVLRLSYEPAFDPLPKPNGQFTLPLDAPVDRSGLSIENIQESFLERLVALRSEEILRGMTTIGPHRDDLRFLSNGVDLGIYGSRGQIRTMMLAIKLAEVSWMRAKTGQLPVLLLDEVLAELDSQRRSDLMELLEDSEQALLTTTDLDMFSAEFIDKANLWHVREGRLV